MVGDGVGFGLGVGAGVFAELGRGAGVADFGAGVTAEPGAGVVAGLVISGSVMRAVSFLGEAGVIPEAPGAPGGVGFKGMVVTPAGGGGATEPGGFGGAGGSVAPGGLGGSGAAPPSEPGGFGGTGAGGGRTEPGGLGGSAGAEGAAGAEGGDGGTPSGLGGSGAPVPLGGGGSGFEGARGGLGSPAAAGDGRLAEDPTAGAVLGSLEVVILGAAAGSPPEEWGTAAGGTEVTEGKLIRTVSRFTAGCSPLGGRVIRMVSVLSGAESGVGWGASSDIRKGSGGRCYRTRRARVSTLERKSSGKFPCFQGCVGNFHLPVFFSWG
jgi:hypothetical protein